MLGCSLFSFHFLWAILCPTAVVLSVFLRDSVMSPPNLSQVKSTWPHLLGPCHDVLYLLSIISPWMVHARSPGESKVKIREVEKREKERERERGGAARNGVVGRVLCVVGNRILRANGSNLLYFFLPSIDLKLSSNENRVPSSCRFDFRRCVVR